MKYKIKVLTGIQIIFCGEINAFDAFDTIKKIQGCDEFPIQSDRMDSVAITIYQDSITFQI